MQLLSSVLPLTLLGLAAAFDPRVDSRCENDGACLSSFKWCADPFSNDCHWPQGASSFWAGQSSSTGILHVDYEFDIEWRSADPSLPVTLRWIGMLPHTYPSRGDEDSGLVEIFATNITNKDGKSTGSYRFKPRRIMSQYIENAPSNASLAEAWLAAGNFVNRLYISQPGIKYENFTFPDNSDEFVLADRQLDMLLNSTQRHFDREWRENQKRWGLGVGIGVGLGLPLLVALTWVAATHVAKGKGKLSDDE